MNTNLNPQPTEEPAASPTPEPAPIAEPVVAKRKGGRPRGPNYKPYVKKGTPNATELSHLGKGVNWRLSEGEKQIIVSLWASGLSTSEVVERVSLEHNIQISLLQVWRYTKAPKWQALIKKIRQETMSDLAAVAGSHKRVRLDRHERIYDRAIKKGDLKHAIIATESQRKEMEGGGDFNFTLNQFNVLSDDELEQKKLEIMQKIQIMNQQKGAITIEQPTDERKAAGSEEGVPSNG